MCDGGDRTRNGFEDLPLQPPAAISTAYTTLHSITIVARVGEERMHCNYAIAVSRTDRGREGELLTVWLCVLTRLLDSTEFPRILFGLEIP